MCDMMTLLMFDAITLKSTVLPSSLTLKIACPCAREQCGRAQRYFSSHRPTSAFEKHPLDQSQ